VAALRTTGAASVLLMAAAAVWLGAEGTLLVLLAIASLVALGWIVVGRRGRARARDAARWWLELGEAELAMAKGEEPRRVPWARVEGVEADEDRLVVRVRVEGEDEVEIPPVWRDDEGGVGLHELEEAIASAWRRGR